MQLPRKRRKHAGHGQEVCGTLSQCIQQLSMLHFDCFKEGCFMYGAPAFTLECVDLAANGKLQACDGWLSLLFDLHKRDWLHIAARMLSPLFWQLTHCGQPYCLLVLLFTCSSYSTMTAA